MHSVDNVNVFLTVANKASVLHLFIVIISKYKSNDDNYYNYNLKVVQNMTQYGFVNYCLVKIF